MEGHGDAAHPRSPKRAGTLSSLAPWEGAQPCETNLHLYLSCPGCGALVRQPWETKAGGIPFRK